MTRELEKATEKTFAIGPFPSRGEKNILVAGSARGGTSAVALLLAILGVPFSCAADPFSFDDDQFSSHKGNLDLFKDGKRSAEFLSTLKAAFHARNATCSTWFAKDPTMSHYLSHAISMATSPVVLFVTRDLTAVSQRAIASSSAGSTTDFFYYFQNALDDYCSAMHVLRHAQCPVLFVSYERLILDPRSGAVEIASYLDIAVNDDTLRAIAATITAGRLSSSVTLPKSEIHGRDGRLLLSKFSIGDNSPSAEADAPSELPAAVEGALHWLNVGNLSSAKAQAQRLPALVQQGAQRAIDVERLTVFTIKSALKDVSAFHVEALFLDAYVSAQDICMRGYYSQAIQHFERARTLSRYVIGDRNYVSGVCYGSYWMLCFMEASNLLYAGHHLAALEAFLSMSRALEGSDIPFISAAPKSPGLEVEVERNLQACRAAIAATGGPERAKDDGI